LSERRFPCWPLSFTACFTHVAVNLFVDHVHPCVRSAEWLPVFLGRCSCNGTRVSTTPNSDPIGGNIGKLLALEPYWKPDPESFPMPNGRRVRSNSKTRPPSLPSLLIPPFDGCYPSYKDPIDVNWARRSVARRAKTARKDATTATAIAELSAVDEVNEDPRRVPPSKSQQSVANRPPPSRLRLRIHHVAIWRRRVPRGNSSGAFPR
jgi:hypothetical protein